MIFINAVLAIIALVVFIFLLINMVIFLMDNAKFLFYYYSVKRKKERSELSPDKSYKFMMELEPVMILFDKNNDDIEKKYSKAVVRGFIKVIILAIVFLALKYYLDNYANYK